jgi:5-methylthioadenosine/S-adenosylhomocysteine deaminase
MQYNRTRSKLDMKERLIIQGATVITLDSQDRVFYGDVVVEGRHITAFGPPFSAAIDPSNDEIVDGRGCALLPGFIQTHVHLCQTLFRGAADDLALIDWLRERVWPMEAAHTAKSVLASARLGIAELIRGGTTCALTMETVSHTEAALRAVADSGFRATVGKCMMDHGEDVPPALREKTADSIAESVDLIKRWHGYDKGRIRCCFAPRFAVSCTRELLEEVARLSREYGVLVHTHASENRDEITIVERMTSMRNIAYLAEVGIAAPHVVLAHCVHLDDAELEILRETGTHVAHCPSSNLKLASGVARIPEMISRGISVSLGADGAPCNNRLDMFTEMRLAALIQKLLHGPRVLPALSVLRMATIGGALSLGLEDEVGSIEIGKLADLQLINLKQPHTTPAPDLVSTIVYAAEAADVVWVAIDGQVVLREGELVTLDEAEVIADANREALRLAGAVKQAV